jgi:hypothetical protein
MMKLLIKVKQNGKPAASPKLSGERFQLPRNRLEHLTNAHKTNHPSLRGAQRRGNPDGLAGWLRRFDKPKRRMDCRVASLLAMTGDLFYGHS